jgi:hypothetical protein
MLNPDIYIWPKDARLNEMGESLETLEKMGVLPLKREDLEKIEKTYVLPRDLLLSLRAVSAYASAVEQLETWRQQGLLLSRESAHDAFLYENLSLEEYAKAARVRCLGHTPAILERLDFLISELTAFPLPRNDLEAEIVTRAVRRLDVLKKEKISPIDSLFIVKTAGLFQRRRGLGRDWLAQYAIAAVGGGLLSWFARFVTGIRSDFFFLLCFIMASLTGLVLALAATGLLPHLLQGETQGGNWRSHRRGNPMAVLVVLAFYLIYAASRNLLHSSPHLFSFSVGAVLGCVVCFGFNWFALARNERVVVDACATYCAQTAEPEDEDLYNLRRRWS